MTAIATLGGLSPWLWMAIGVAALLLWLTQNRRTEQQRQSNAAHWSWWLRWWLLGESQGEPPLVRGWLPWVGVLPAFAKDAGNLLFRCKERHGDVFTLIVAGQRLTFLTDPACYGQIFKAKKELLSFRQLAEDVSDKAFALPVHEIPPEKEQVLARQYITCLQGEELGALTLNMQRHLHHIFAQQLLMAPKQAGEEEKNEGDNGWRTGHLFEFVTRVMNEAGIKTVFGEECWSESMLQQHLTFDGGFPLLVAGMPKWMAKKPIAAREALWNLFLEAFSPSTKGKHDDASRLIREREEMFGRESPDQALLLSKLHTSILWAAQANTVPATFWTIAYLLNDPSAKQSIQQELDDVLSTVHPSSSLKELNITNAATEDLFFKERAEMNQLQRLESAISEALRLTSGGLTGRKVLVNQELTLRTTGRSYKLRAGDHLSLYPYLSHRDPEIYTEAERFVFDRFLSPSTAELPFLPFGGGISQCPGRFFARNEIKLFVALFLRCFEVELLLPTALSLDDPRWPQLDQSRVGLGILPPTFDIPFRFRLR
ncbi:sterol 12-alpha-hydroxylase [Balamuthia mandrillaris]